jgi:hypothetical protein
MGGRRCVWWVGAAGGLRVVGGAMIVARRGAGLETVGRVGGEVATNFAHVRMGGRALAAYRTI